jgi:hypothetical protein
MITLSRKPIIRVKYRKPNKALPARLNASCPEDSIVIQFDYSISVSDNYINACKKLLNQIGWGGDFVGCEVQDSVCIFMEISQ